jgi:mannose-1-phosphate guanylyltransferase
LTGPDRIIVVAGQGHAPAIAEQLPELASTNLVVEPAPRDSMPAIALAAAIGWRRFGDIVLGSFAADQVIDAGGASPAVDGRGHPHETADTLRSGAVGIGPAAPPEPPSGLPTPFELAVTGARLAAAEGLIATIGIQPTGPSTAYGYIRAGDSVGLLGRPDVRYVEAFKEKPDLATAAGYLQSGDYRWNAGMFVFKPSVLFRWLRELRPGFADGIERLADAWDTARRGAVAREVWPTLPAVAIDHAVAEPVAARGGMATAPGDFSWSDVGDFDSLAVFARGGALRLAAGPTPMAVDSPGALVIGETGQRVGVLGVPDAVVVVTDGAVLVTTREHAQRVKDLAVAVEAADGEDADRADETVNAGPDVAEDPRDCGDPAAARGGGCRV